MAQVRRLRPLDSLRDSMGLKALIRRPRRRTRAHWDGKRLTEADRLVTVGLYARPGKAGHGCRGLPSGWADGDGVTNWTRSARWRAWPHIGRVLCAEYVPGAGSAAGYQAMDGRSRPRSRASCYR